MNASMGVRTQGVRTDLSVNWGTGGRTTFWKAQYLPRAPIKESSYPLQRFQRPPGTQAERLASTGHSLHEGEDLARQVLLRSLREH